MMLKEVNKRIARLRAKTGRDYRISFNRSGNMGRLWLYTTNTPLGVELSPLVKLNELIKYIDFEASKKEG